MSQIFTYGLLIALPLLGGLMSLFGRSYHRVSVAIVGLGLIGAFQIFFGATWSFSWKWIAGINLGFNVDHISGLLILLVYLISFLVHLFSLHYMEADTHSPRYFFKLGFFTSSMLGLLAADSLVLVFIFWELVGFSSYLLIGFWFSDPAKTQSAKSAFMVNRVADAFLLVGIILLIFVHGVSSLSEIGGVETLPLLASVFLTIGAFGKSAQFPFSAWLKQAMAGPTPVSALIHAATMVTAGVYLLIRFSPILPEPVMLLISLIGAATAFMAAFSATSQSDIKAVLAYSTISQLGFMTAGIGAGAADASLFHLWTHAFFKAGLFLSAGSVIHFLQHHQLTDSQDMTQMGGLRKYLPFTFIAFILCGAALAGIPFFSGFLSKEGILTALLDQAFAKGGVYFLIAALGFAGAFLTPYYMLRQVILVFFGAPKSDYHSHPEPSGTVKFPLIFLGLASLWIFFSLSPFNAHGWWLKSFSGVQESHGAHAAFALMLSLILTAGGLVLAYIRFGTGNPKVQNHGSFLRALSLQGWFLESIYTGVSQGFISVSKFAAKMDHKVIDTSVNGFGIFWVVLAKVVGWVDRYIVDGIINGIAALSRFIGKILARIQAPMIQFQVVFAVVVLIIVLIWIQKL